MRRTVLYISMSLDGCLARPDGDVSWLAGQDPDDPDPGTYPAFLSTVDTVAMGWTTYHQVVTQLSPDSWPYRGLDCYVLTHRPLPPQTEKIQAFSGPAHQLVEQLKREPAGRDIWICGGADTAAPPLIGLSGVLIGPAGDTTLIRRGIRRDTFPTQGGRL